MSDRELSTTQINAGEITATSPFSHFVEVGLPVEKRREMEGAPWMLAGWLQRAGIDIRRPVEEWCDPRTGTLYFRQPRDA